MNQSALGLYFEEFIIGEEIKHSLSKTIFESDNNLFCLLTMNHHPVHTNIDYANENQHGKRQFWRPLAETLIQTTFGEVRVIMVYLRLNFMISPESRRERTEYDKFWYNAIVSQHDDRRPRFDAMEPGRRLGERSPGADEPGGVQKWYHKHCRRCDVYRLPHRVTKCVTRYATMSSRFLKTPIFCLKSEPTESGIPRPMNLSTSCCYKFTRRKNMVKSLQ